MVKKYCIIFLFCFLSHLTYAQVKIEKESRVVSNDVPEIAIKWLEDVFDHKKKLKWYFEISADSHSYEAKFIRKGKKFSVEFSEEGIIEDIEVFEHCETSNSKKLWEGLFDNNGQIQMSREIILTPSNNLFY